MTSTFSPALTPLLSLSFSGLALSCLSCLSCLGDETLALHELFPLLFCLRMTEGEMFDFTLDLDSASLFSLLAI